MEAMDWGQLGACVALAVLVGTATYHGVAGYYHLRYYVRRRHEPETWKLQPRRFLSPKLHRLAVLSGTGNMVLGGILSGFFLYGVSKDLIPTALYMDPSKYGWPYTIASTVGYFVVSDGMAYYVHRTLHGKWLFRNVHRFHHRFVATSPYVATALHPAELLCLQAATFLPMFFVPLHGLGVAAVLIYILVFNIVDHSGVRLVSALPWQGPSAYHDDHHAHFHVNFGQHLMFFDRIHGTLRRKGRKYGKHVFGGRGDPQDSDRERLEPFVSY